MNFTYTAQPTGTDLISLADMKQFLRVDHSDEDITIRAIIDAAAQSVQDYTGRHFVDTNWTMLIKTFYNIEAPYSASTVTSVKYYKPNEAALTVLDSTKYYSGTQLGIFRINFLDTPSVNEDRFGGVEIVGTVLNQINPPLTHAIKMLAAHYYENRRAVVVGTLSAIEIPLGVKAIINPYRLINLR